MLQAFTVPQLNFFFLIGNVVKEEYWLQKVDDSVSSVSPGFGIRSSVQLIIAQMFNSIFKLRDIKRSLVQELAALAEKYTTQ